MEIPWRVSANADTFGDNRALRTFDWSDYVNGERIRDKFLTENDKAWLTKRPMRKPRDLNEFCKRPALVLVDMYRGAFGDRPEPILEQLERWPDTCGMNGWNALGPISQLLDACRETGMPVVHTKGVDNETIKGQHRYAPPSPNDTSQAAKKFIHAATRFEIIPEVAPLEHEVVIEKMSSSAFWGTPLIGHLIREQVDTLIVCGEVTEGCVRETVVEGTTYGFNVVVPEECVFNRLESTHAMALFSMQRIAEIVSLDDVLIFLKNGL